MAIQTTIKTDRGEVEELHPNDPRYWQGPYRFEPYPMMLFRASEAKYQDDDIEAVIVKTEAERKAKGAAWKESRDEARAYFDGLEADIARAAAETKAAAQHMSGKAQAELRAAEVGTDAFVTDVTPKRSHHRKKVTSDGESE